MWLVSPGGGKVSKVAQIFMATPAPPPGVWRAAMVAFALFTISKCTELLRWSSPDPVLEVFPCIVQKFVFKTSRKRSVAAGKKLPARALQVLLPYDPFHHHHMEGRRLTANTN